MATKLEAVALAQLTQHLTKHGVANAVEYASEFQRLARRLNRYNETACNYSLTTQQQNRVNALVKKVKDLAALVNIGVKFNGDPRGYAVKLLFPSGVYNTWGGKEEGWGI